MGSRPRDILAEQESIARDITSRPRKFVRRSMRTLRRWHSYGWSGILGRARPWLVVALALNALQSRCRSSVTQCAAPLGEGMAQRDQEPPQFPLFPASGSMSTANLSTTRRALRPSISRFIPTHSAQHARRVRESRYRPARGTRIRQLSKNGGSLSQAHALRIQQRRVRLPGAPR